MSLGLVGRKCGMTRIFTDAGESVPVTVIEVEPNNVIQLKNQDTDQYCSVQISTGSKKASRVNKPMAGHFSKANTTAGSVVKEFRLSEKQMEGLEVGSQIPLDIFSEGQAVDVQGVTKGKGFAGVIKRHHFKMQDATHGNSLAHRAPGSIGQCQTPGRVFKGKKMAGHMGSVNRTVQNLKVVKIDAEKNIIMIKGALPGAPGGYVVISSSVKARGEG